LSQRLRASSWSSRARRLVPLSRVLGAKVRRFAWALALLVALLVCLLPVVGVSAYYIFVSTVVFLYIPLAIGQNLVTGNTGVLSMGQAALYGVGAYVTAILSTRYGVSAPLALVAAVVAAGLAGVAIALTTVKVYGDYLFIVTLGVNLIFLDIVNQAPGAGGAAGIAGVPAPSLGPLRIMTPTAFFYFGFAAVVVCILLAVVILRSRLGRAMEAVRDDALVAGTLGLREMPIKVGVSGIAGAMAGLSGGVLAYFLTFVGPQDFTTTASLLIFEMVIIGGLGSLWGSVLGAVLLIAIPEVLRSVEAYSIGIGGAAIVVMMIFRPQGIMGARSIAR